MDIPEDVIILAIDGGGHRQRLVKTNKEVEILAEAEVPYKDGMTEEELNKLCIEVAYDILGNEKDKLYGIVQGSSGIPQRDGSFTNNPNPPDSMKGRISNLPALAKEFGISLEERCAWNNDCTTGAMVATSNYGLSRQSFRGKSELKVAPKGESFLFRITARPGDDFRKGYSKVAYITISSGTNDGYVIILDIPCVGQYYVIDKGEFGTVPEAGHGFYAKKDPFGNLLECGCNGIGHFEAAVAGGTGKSGVSGIMRKGVRTGKIYSGPLFDTIVSTPDTIEGNLTLPQKLYAIKPGEDPNADKLKHFVAEAVAYKIGEFWGKQGVGKIEFGGGMMRDYDQILFPAIKMILRSPRDFALQDLSLNTFPDIGVPRDYGDDYIWKGPVFMLLNKERLIVTGTENYKREA